MSQPKDLKELTLKKSAAAENAENDADAHRFVSLQNLDLCDKARGHCRDEENKVIEDGKVIVDQTPSSEVKNDAIKNSQDVNLKKAASSYVALGIYGMAGFQLALSVVLGLVFGDWLDDRWQTTPWLTITGLFLGLASGLYQLIRLLNNDRFSK